MASVSDVWREASERWPDRPAVTDASAKSLTYGQMWEQAAAHAAVLRRHGVREGERVLLAVDRSVGTVVSLLGALRLGATAVPVPMGMEAAALVRRLNVAGSKFVLDADGSVRAVPGAAGTEPDPSAPAWLIFTSGSTATPRAVSSPHAAVLFVMGAILDRLGYRADDVVLSMLPLTFDYGLYQALLCARSGAHLILANPRYVVRLPSLARDLGASVLPLVPSLAKGGVARGGQAPDVRLVTTTGERMPTETVERLAVVFPTADIRLMYGTTECKRISIQRGDAVRAESGSSGPPLLGTEVRINSTSGVSEPGWGEIVVSGPHVMAGYWRDPSATAATFRRQDGRTWLHTGDIGWIDRFGDIHVEGRMDDLLKIKGVRTSVTEIESAAHRIPGVSEAALLVAPDWEPVLFVAAVGQTAASVHELLSLDLGHEGVPSRCVVVSELPHTPHGKVDRQALLNGHLG